MDRRIQKTQKAIQNALYELLLEKDFAKITINQIADRANVNRGTIYLHYQDKYHLLKQCIEEHIEQLTIFCVPEGQEDSSHSNFSTMDSLLPTFTYLEENRIFFMSVLNNQVVPFLRERLHQIMVDGIRRQIKMNGMNRDMNTEVVIQFLASAAIGVIEWWISNKMPVPKEEVAEQLWQLLYRNQ